MANDEVDYPIVEKNAMDFEKTERRDHQEHRTYFYLHLRHPEISNLLPSTSIPLL